MVVLEAVVETFSNLTFQLEQVLLVRLADKV